VNAFFYSFFLRGIETFYFSMLLAKSWFWRMFFLFTFQLKSLKKCFSTFGKILVLANALFYLNSFVKSLENLNFSAFDKILGLANAFFYLNSICKSIEKLIFAAFGKFLVLFFLIQILI